MVTTVDMSRRLGPLPAVAVAVGVGLLVGGLTAFGQGWLPESVGSLANSVGTWALAAFLLALLAPTGRSAALAGCCALACMLAGYVVANQLRGYPSSSGLLVFWGAAALAAGPLLGLGACWLRWRRGAWAALGAGGLSGLLVGEGVYGLRYVAETTSPPYWWGELVVGVLALVVLSAWRLRHWRTVRIATVVAAAVAVAFVLLYRYGGAVISLL